MKHLNPNNKKWNTLREEDKYWITKALELGGVLQRLEITDKKPAEWKDILPEPPRKNSRNIYRVKPDYFLAQYLKKLELDEKQAEAKQEKRSEVKEKNKNKKKKKKNRKANL